MIRAFVAIEIDADLKHALENVQATLRAHVQKPIGPNVRIQWIRAESLHLTLKFLGDIDEAQVPAIGSALEQVARAQTAFAVKASGAGMFPDVCAPRIVWVGLTGAMDRLTQLVAAVESALAPLGFPSEGKPFAPHLTIARVKEGQRDVGRALASGNMLEQMAQVGVMPVRAIALMKSELHPSGSIYTRVHEATLKEA
jgi:2'-5' RNA ligase